MASISINILPPSPAAVLFMISAPAIPTVHLDVTARGKDATTTTGLAVFYERGVHDQTASTDIALNQEAATVATVPAIGNYAAVKR
ncbi:hypothetical protein BK142_02070 [Paenibacillus glucanolyticus]|nr:hypothetical protein BK142_02070 [Paenibacillus glucanolyticus]